MPIPVSATEISIAPLPSPARRARNVTVPVLVNLQALLKRLSRICRSRIGIDGDGAEIVLAFDDEAVLVLLSELTRGADDLVDQ